VVGPHWLHYCADDDGRPWETLRAADFYPSARGGRPPRFYDWGVRVTDWLFGVLVVCLVAVLCVGAVAAGLDLSTRESRTKALVGSLVLGGSFSLLTGAWIGLCVPAAVLVLMGGGFSQDAEPSSR
jgi:hypothetical protein